MAQAFDSDRLELGEAALPVAEQVRTAGGTADRVGAFTVSETGVLAYQPVEGSPRSQLVWFDRAGTQTGVLGDQADYGAVELSPDDTRAAVTLLDDNLRTLDIWLYDIARAVRTKFTFDPANENTVVWSPDGSRIVFNSGAKGRLAGGEVTGMDLYAKSSTGAGDDELLLDAPQNLYAESISADGLLLFTVGTFGSPTGNDLRTLPLAAGGKIGPFLETSFNEIRGRFSPDGRWVAYQSDQSGRREVYVTSYPHPAEKWQISTGGGTDPRWRDDGRELFYLTPDDALMAVPVDGRGSAFHVGPGQRLFPLRLNPPHSIRRYDGSQDGERFLVNTLVDQAPAPITVVINWPALLSE